MADSPYVASAPSAPPANPWIVSPLFDGLFLIGTPLVIVAACLPLSSLLAAVNPVVLIGIISIGHHLPGFLRAYGDRELFAQYRLRLLVVPPLWFVGVLWLTCHQMPGIKVLTILWGFWHGMMQIYGFMRIYDAKRGQTAGWTARLDWWMCLTGFVAMLCWSRSSAKLFLEAAEQSGLFYLSLLFSPPMQVAAAMAFGGVAVAYLVHTVRMYRRGRPVAPAKLLLLAVTLAFLHFSWVMVEGNLWLGLGAWEIFHDVQYNAIVWAYNGRVVKKGAASSLLRYVFRPRWNALGLYVALIAAYGGLQYASAAAYPTDTAQNTFAAFFITSALLHYYYDGFIWRVRSPKTRRDLGIPERQSTPLARGALSPTSFWKDLRQLAYPAIPLGLLAVLDAHRVQWELPMRQSLVWLVPGSKHYHDELGSAYLARGRLAEAVAEHRRAVALDPTFARGHCHLGIALADMGNATGAEASFRQVLGSFCPSPAEVALSVAFLLPPQHRPSRSVEVLRKGTDHEPEHAALTDRLARALLGYQTGEADLAEATQWAEQACRLTRWRDPRYLDTLAEAYAAQRRFPDALRTAEAGLHAARVMEHRPLIQGLEQRILHYRAAPPRGGMGMGGS